MSGLTILWRKLTAFIFFFINIGKRLLCFLKIRRRKNSGNLLPLANHYPSPPDVTHAVPGNEADLEMEAWDSWGVEDKSSNANKNQASHYSNSNQASHYGNRNQAEPESEPEPDYFADMTPEVKKTAKILVKKREDYSYNSSGGNFSNRLAMNSVIPTQMSPDLDEWKEEEPGWEGEDISWEADAVLKEKRRMERESRQQEQQRKKMERDAQRSRKDSGSFTAVKLS